MTQVTKKMIQRGHVNLISEDPLILQGKTPSGIIYLRDTKDIGLAGYIGVNSISTSIDNL